MNFFPHDLYSFHLYTLFFYFLFFFPHISHDLWKKALNILSIFVCQLPYKSSKFHPFIYHPFLRSL